MKRTVTIPQFVSPFLRSLLDGSADTPVSQREVKARVWPEIEPMRKPEIFVLHAAMVDTLVDFVDYGIEDSNDFEPTNAEVFLIDMLTDVSRNRAPASTLRIACLRMACIIASWNALVKRPG